MANLKKIAFFGVKYFPARGGTSRVVENLILKLVHNYEITVYCYKNNLAKNHITGVNVIEFPEIKFGNIGVFIYYLLCYCHIRIKGNYDIIHAHKIDSFLFIRGLAKCGEVIATAHEAPYRRDKWSMLAKMFFKLSERCYLNFKGIKTAISKPLCEFYKEKYNVDVLFIANGINKFEEGSVSSVEDFWPKDVPIGSPFVLFAARRIMGTKGLHTMIEAYKRINFKGNIFVAGELNNVPSYMKRIKEISKGLNVYLLGFVSPLSSLLDLVRKSDYFVFPSETEGMSIMLLEVASCGKPIIASDIPENTQVFDEKDVLFFKSKDVSDLSEKLCWAANHKAEFYAKGLHAKNKVLTKYTWDQIALEYISLYNSIGCKS